MRIELSVEGAGESCDVAVEGPDPLPWGQVRQRVLTAAGLPAQSAVFVRGGGVPDTARVGDAGLITGAVLRTHPGDEDAATRGGRMLLVSGGPSAGRSVPLRTGRLLIGRDPGCGLLLDDDAVSRRHAVLEVGRTAVVVRDVGSSNGTYLDGTAVGGRAVVGAGQLVRVGESLLAVDEGGGEPASVTARPGGLSVNRAPRRTGSAAPTVVDVAVGPPQTSARPVQWLAALLPAAAGGALAWVTGSIQFLLFTLLTPVLVLSTSLGDRLRGVRRNRATRTAHRLARAESERAIADGLHCEMLARRDAAPDPATVARIAMMPGRRLWERRRSDTDQLVIRVGSADLPSRLQARAGTVHRSAGTVPDVPVTLDLRRGPLGLVGPPQSTRAVARWVVAQLAVLVSPTDLGIALFLSSGDDAWHWARWLPHLRARVAVTPQEWAELSTLITATCRSPSSTPGRTPGRAMLLVLDAADEIATAPALVSLLADGDTTAVTAICLARDTARLPRLCTTIARIGGDAGTRITLPAAEGAPPNAAVDAVADQVSADWAEHVARALAPLVDGGATGDDVLPASASLLEVLDLPRPSADDVTRLWACSDGGLGVVIGVGAHGPVAVDLDLDGPHALIGGTTGSGKSELLQTLVTGLALRHPPSEVTFVLIDYKGGAAFAGCDQLPHTAGLVTDLDPHLTRRALRSLDAEIRRRERLFAGVGASDLRAYRAGHPAVSLARLVIVVDEFATLADELPDFVRGLVGVAQRGRSLGLHLVLATQRPGKAVSPEIRANTGLRIALRVADPSESADIIDAPNAASIPRDLPGRAYLRLGSELTCLQVARPLPDRPTEPRVEVLDRWRRPSTTDVGTGSDWSGVAPLVALARAAAAAAGHRPAVGPWLPPLPAELDVSELAAAELADGGPSRPPWQIAYGLLDLPDTQQQVPLTMKLARPGATLVCGAARSGRTSALITLALRAAERIEPACLEIHLVDGAGRLLAALRDLPHVATALGPADVSLVPTLLRRLGTPAQTPRYRLLLVDVFDRVLAASDEHAPSGLADALLDVLSAASDTGLTTVVAGGRPLLAPRFASAFGTRLLLRLSDRADYSLAGLDPAAVPAAMPPGRGVRVTDAAEFQLARPSGGEPQTARLVHDLATRWRDAEPPVRSVVVRPLPRCVESAGLQTPAGGLLLGVGGDAAEPLAVDPFAGARRMLVAGPPRSGRSTVLATLLVEAVRAGLHVLVAAPNLSPLSALAHRLGLRVIDPDDPPSPVGDRPAGRTLVLVDDSDAFVDTPAGEQLSGLLRHGGEGIAAIVSARSDDLATAYRGLGVEVRRARSGLLLQPGPLDGELLGVHLRRGPRPALGPAPPGRGLLINVETWPATAADGEPVPVQVARSEAGVRRPARPYGDSGDPSAESCSP